MRLLFLNPSQYVDWRHEPSNHELRLPILASGLVSEHRDFAYVERLRAVGRDAMLQELRALVRSFVPDIIVYSNTHPERRIQPAELDSLRSGTTKILTALWDANDRPNDQETEFFHASDGLAIGDSLFTYARYRLLAENHFPGKAVLYLHGHQVLPELFHAGDGAKAYDVSHVGTIYGGRQAFIEGLAAALPPQRSVSVFGGLFQRSEASRTPERVLFHYRPNDAFLAVEDYARILRQSRCCLILQTDPGYQRIRGKTFEVLASRALPVVQDMKEYRLVLPPESLLVAGSPDDAARQIADVLANPADYTRRATLGYEWFRDTFDIRAFWREGLEATANGRMPDIRNPLARQAFADLRRDLWTHYSGAPSADSLLKLIFS